MRWKIFYADGSTFSDLEGRPEWAPRVGVQCVLQADDRVGYELVGENSTVTRSPDGYWIWKEDRWFESDTPGFWDYLMHHHDGPCIVLFGRWMTDEKYEAIVREAVRQGKSAWKPRETRP